MIKSESKMKKTYIAPRSESINLYAESAMMLSVSGGQHTGGFGAKTQSADESFSDMPWMESDEADVEE